MQNYVWFKFPWIFSIMIAVNKEKPNTDHQMI